ncbi:hypothetical protein [Streptomyces sp. AS58]|uniref:hypothetical protein n=1 Tax=Streptomyces sp. AS58 TaxID=1519489 RepID=UPI000A59AC9E|nr:hypothetical protein [Streptomyces sp. AS58]
MRHLARTVLGITLATVIAVGTAATAHSAERQAEPRAAAAGPCSPGVVVPSTTEYDGIPGPNFWKLVQCLGAQGGYTGPIDGVLGYNSWMGVQKRLDSLLFYTPPTYTGSGDVETWKGLQRYAGHYGTYEGPVDGYPGVNTYKGLAYALNERIALRHP